MSIDLWLAFILTTAALLAIPGPVVVLLLGHTLDHGRSAAWAAVPGVMLGDFVAMSASLAGAGAVLAASATLFTAMKLIGAGYLLWLGIDMIRRGARAPRASVTLTRIGWSERFRQAFLVTAFNPKDIVFFVAFLPQFMDPTAPMALQLVIIEATFLAMVAVSTTLWILLGSGAVARLDRGAGLQRLNRVGGSCLIGAGALTALARRAT